MDVVRHQPNQGWIEVIVGSMFSGKSEELIRRLRRAQIARQKVQIFKPTVDTRYDEDHIVSHSEMRIPSRAVGNSRELLDLVEADTEVVGIDEGQFFDQDLPAVCNELADRGKRVIVAGLDQDYLGKPFEPMPSPFSEGAPAATEATGNSPVEIAVVSVAGVDRAAAGRCARSR